MRRRMPLSCQIDMADIVNGYRAASGLTYERTAALLQLDPSTVSRYLTASSPIPTHRLITILRIYGVTVDELLEDMAAIGWRLVQPSPIHAPRWERFRRAG